MYFTYFLNTEDINFNPGVNTMRDALRVYVGSDDGGWDLVATNDLYVGPGMNDDEFDNSRGIAVQPLFDSTGNWRQARVDLSPFAGQSNLKLRFEFSTAGDTNLGDVNTDGSELRAIPGWQLRDGDTFTIDGQVFEFDLGITITTPSGRKSRTGRR